MAIFRKLKIFLALCFFVGNVVASSNFQPASSSQLPSIADMGAASLPSLPPQFDQDLERDSRDFIDQVNAKCYMVRKIVFILFQSRNNPQVESFEDFKTNFGSMLNLLSFNWGIIKLRKGQERVKIERLMVNKLLTLNESTKKDVEMLRGRNCCDLRKSDYLNNDKTIADLIRAIETDSVNVFISTTWSDINTAAYAVEYLEIIKRQRRIAQQSAFLSLVPPTYQEAMRLPKSSDLLPPAGVGKLSDFDEGELE